MKIKIKKLSAYRKVKLAALLIFVFVSGYQLMNLTIHMNDYEIVQAAYTKKYEAVYLYDMDGDTAVFALDGKEVVCRFLAVDCPEHGDEGYDAANSFTRKQLSSARKIVLELDPHSEEYDRYDRLLAWVWVDDELLQAKLIRYGHASISYLFGNYLYTDQLYRIEKKAKKSQ